MKPTWRELQISRHKHQLSHGFDEFDIKNPISKGFN